MFKVTVPNHEPVYFSDEKLLESFCLELNSHGIWYEIEKVS